MKIKAPDALLAAEVSRRGLMKTTAIGGLALASNALTLPFSRMAHAADTPAPASEKVVWSACTVNCGSRCPLRMHVVDGAIKYVETDNTGDDNYDGLHQVRACLRGRSMRRRVYNPDRLKYPMKRVGKRGERQVLVAHPVALVRHMVVLAALRVVEKRRLRGGHAQTAPLQILPDNDAGAHVAPHDVPYPAHAGALVTCPPILVLVRELVEI